MQIKLNETSLEIWDNTYRYGVDEATPNDTFRRVAKAVASVEATDEDKAKYEELFFNIMSTLKFVPGGRILSNAGTKRDCSLFNCFVYSVADTDAEDVDSVPQIYEFLKKQALTLKSEGGYGTNASWLRPAGSYIRGIDSYSPGAVKFFELWDKSSEIVTAGYSGDVEKRDTAKKKIRKGAQMLCLEVWHPDIIEFITAKQTPGRLTKFNVSVGITEGFMQAVQDDADWELIFPDTEHPDYKKFWRGNIADWKARGYPVKVHKVVKARWLWNLIMQSTYNSAEPGVLFLDLINKLNPLAYAEYVCTSNPCGEIPMSTGVCDLGSINLMAFVEVDENGKPYFDFVGFSEVVKLGVRFLDNVLDISLVPLPEYAVSVREKRRIGLGTMGLGSALFAMGIRYGSPESLSLIDSIYRTKCESELLASAELGAQKGSFPLFKPAEYFNSTYWRTLPISNDVKAAIVKLWAMRNSHHSMNAPTGNTSIFAGCVSGGVEPVFMREYVRWVIVPEAEQRRLRADGLDYPDVQKGEWYETPIFHFKMRGNEQVLCGSYKGKMYEIDKNRGLVVAVYMTDAGWEAAKAIYQSRLDEMVANGIFDTTEKLTVQEHCSVLATVAKYVNQSCSKTVNVPANYPFDEFKSIYLEAYKNGVKGVTTYREGCRAAVLESVDAADNTATVKHKVKRRPNIVNADVYHSTINRTRYYVVVGQIDGVPYEVFTGLNHDENGDECIPKRITYGVVKKVGGGKYVLLAGEKSYPLSSGPHDPTAEAMTRLVSLLLRTEPGCLGHVIDQLEKSQGPIVSFTRVVARALKKYLPENTISTHTCPRCGAKMYRQEGCLICLNCNESKCS